MEFHKSLKLLNIARLDNGFVKLFTELNHNYNIGNRLYIVGGFYDNTKSLQYSNLFTGTETELNPYENNGYIVLDVDYTEHSITINYEVEVVSSIPQLVFPYGDLNNKFGNYEDTINPAFNHVNDDRHDNGIYISNAVFNNGIFNNGTINNGILGTRENRVYLGPSENQQTLHSQNTIDIQHAIAPNAELISGEINSKFDNSIITNKLSVIVDLSTNAIEPFAFSPIQILGNNNNGFGFSYFEKFINVSINTEINSGNFIHESEFLQLQDININNANLGSERVFSNYNNTVISNCVLNNCKINNITGSNLTINNSIVKNEIEIDVLSASFSGGVLFLSVNHQNLANAEIDNFFYEYILSGVVGPNSEIDTLINIATQFELVDLSYDFGDITSTYMEFELTSPISGQKQLDALAFFENNLNLFDFSDVKLITPNTSTQLEINNSTVSTFINTPNNNNIIINDSDIINGYYNDTHFNNCEFIGSGSSAPVHLYNVIVQYTNIPTNYEYCVIKGGKHSGSIGKSVLIDGYYYDVDLINVNFDLIDSTDDKFMYQARLNNNVKISDTVIWDKVQINWNSSDDIQNNNGDLVLVPVSYLGDRKTPWITSIDTHDLSSDPYAENVKYVKGINGTDIQFYNSQLITEDISVGIAPVFISKFVIPNLFNTLVNNYDGSFISIIRLSDMSQIPMSSNWQNLNSNIYPLLSRYIDTSLEQRLLNRRDNVLSGNTTTFDNSTLTAVDDNFVLDTQGELDLIPRTPISSEITIYDTSGPLQDACDPNFSGEFADAISLTIIPDVGPNIPENTSGPTEVTGNEFTSIINFDTSFINTFSSGVQPQTFVPNCFLEIERVIVYKTEIATGNIVEITPIICNYLPLIPGKNERRLDETSLVQSEYNFVFDLVDNNGNPIVIDTTAGFTNFIEIEYWITYNYQLTAPTNAQDGTSVVWRGGNRDKFVKFVNTVHSNQTFNLITTQGDNIINQNNDTVSWI